ncbi:pilin [Patescibacteria group bacterium]
MFKKLITTGILLIIIVTTMPLAAAQRAIDPDLKPENAPGVPLTGPARMECIQKHDKALYNEIQTELKTKTTEKEKEALIKIYEDDIKKYWDENSSMCRGFEEEPITAFIQILAGALLMLTGGVAVIVIAIGGIMYVTSRGNQQQMEYAKNTLTYGIIGMVLIIFSYYIVKFVLQLIIGS